MALSDKQLAAKAKAEANGEVFIPPSQYKKIMSKNAPRNSKGNRSSTAPAYNHYKKNFPVRDRVDPELNELIDQTLNPSDVTYPKRYPNIYGPTAIYKSRNVVNLPTAADNSMAIVVEPRLRDSIFYTAGTSYSTELFTVATAGLKPRSYSYVSGYRNYILNYGGHFKMTNGLCLFPSGSTEVDDRLLYNVGFVDTAGGRSLTVYAQFSPPGVGDSRILIVELYDSAFNIISTNQGTTSASGLAVVAVIPAQYLNSAYMAIRVVFNEAYTGPIDINLATNINTTLTMNIPDHTYLMRNVGLNGVDTIENSAEKYNVIAQSMLITSNQSDLVNQGQIATARVPAGTIMCDDTTGDQFDNWFGYISSLSTNSYNGPSKDGGYSFYLGQDPLSYYLRRIQDAAAVELPYMVAEIRDLSDDQTNSFRLQVDSIVQFSTNSNIYALEASPIYRDLELLNGILSNIPSSYCNPLHKEHLKKALKSAGRKIAKMMSNPKTYQNIGKVMSTIVPLLV